MALPIPTTDNTNKNKCMKQSREPNMLSDLPHDVLFIVYNYLDSFSKAHLRFTSMTTHIDMMGCPLDLIQITSEWPSEYTDNESSHALIQLVRSCASMKFIKRQATNLCGCNASRQLQLIDFRTVKVNETLCSELTQSQLSLLGIGRSWSITGIELNSRDTAWREICNIISKHNAYRSLKKMSFKLWGDDNVVDIIDAMSSSCDVTGYVEDISIYGTGYVDPSPSVGLLLRSFKNLCHIDFHFISVDGSLNDFVQYSPQIEELILIETNITGDISCLGQLKNIKELTISSATSNVDEVYGNIGSLSSCTKLTGLTIDSKNITGNISSLITLTNLKRLSLYKTKVEGGIESLLGSLSILKSLSLSNNSNLTGELVLTRNIELETLYLWGNDNIHLELSSLTHLKNLKNCYIYHLRNVKGDIRELSSLTKLENLKIGGLSCPQVRVLPSNFQAVGATLP